MTSPTPRVSIVVPTWDGYRDGCVPRLLASIERQDFKDHEVLLIQGVKPQGKAINQGAAKAQGEILVILDDDAELVDEQVLTRIVETLDAHPEVGMAGASIVVAADAKPFQQRAARQFPRLCTPVVDTVTDSDMACHGCCAIPLAVFREIGGEREDILRGLDPDLRVRLRSAGYRVVLAPQARIYHPLPKDWNALLRIFFRNGYGSAYAQRFRPETVYETHEELHDHTFSPRSSLASRVLRFPLRLLRALAAGQTLRFGAYSSYALGYAWAWLSAKELPQ